MSLHEKKMAVLSTVADAGFISTWLWYEQMRRELAKEMQSRAPSKRGVGNLYESLKNLKIPILHFQPFKNF